ncbi:peptidase, M23/M37 family protein [Oceanobacter sp. RED65]|uniref:Peptidase, M23/M37 family protein n=2 Tax=Bermanella marisrubri TaxID=207949 RepID=Q1N0J2_9GAMM|nr:peptidase, M23/M37 family protein [Oceanobacter sp. RED65] [Bermanella marisrubri]
MMQIKNGLLCLCLCFLAITPLHAIETLAVPGGIVTFDVESSEYPEVAFQDKPVAVIPNGQNWRAVLGLPLSIKPGEHSITINGKSRTFDVQDKQYKEQHITLKTRKHIDLSQEDLARHRKEKAKAMAAYAHFERQRMPDFAFLKPVDGPYSSPFGLRRFFNGEPRRPHSGLDIAAPTGTDIKAPADGKVVLTGNFFFNGNVVYVDHGQGLISMFCHLDEILVEQGSILEKGEILGKVGATGRVTGPHLHWSVSLNNSRIDPMLLLPESAQVSAQD